MHILENNDVRQYEFKIISIEGLNGFLNHTMDLKSEGITILHGPNGCGKTTFLEIINYCFEQNYDELVKYDFDTLKIIFLDNLTGKESIFELKQKRIDLKTFQEIHLKILDNAEFKLSFFESSLNGYNIKSKPYYSYQEQQNLSCRIRGKSLSKFEKNEDEFLEIIFEYEGRSSRYMFNLDDLLNKAEEKLENFELKSPNNISNYDDTNVIEYNKIFDFIQDNKFYMVNTQRLLNIQNLNSRLSYTYRSERSYKERENIDSYLMIENHAKNLSNQISKSFTDSAEKIEKADKSFPQRLIQEFKDSDIDNVDIIRNRYKETENKINRILKAGLLLREKNISLPTENIDDIYIKKVLQLYLQDLNEKLIPYEDILEKIETFQEIISSKIKNKEMRINHDDGFYFISKIDEKKLKLRKLSSGEQHQIVLFYELIFLANSGTYYLIDEPEISLHVDWQRSFLDDIARVEKLRGHKFIIATHSPQIIGSRRSLCVALDGGIL